MKDVGDRIALWSGPRNLSTALMRSWGSRPDTAVSDEPFYAYYLHKTGIEHPGRAEIIAQYDTDWRKVASRLNGPIPNGKSIWYQKHMTHHILPEMTLDWLAEFKHAFLIRNPAEVLASYTRVRESVSLDDLGLPQQIRLYEYVMSLGGNPPPVLDSRDLRRDPRHSLELLCAALEIPFMEQMLSWRAGPRESDGIWSKYWYASVAESTGFKPYEEVEARVDPALEDIHGEAMNYYDRLHAARLGG